MSTSQRCQAVHTWCAPFKQYLPVQSVLTFFAIFSDSTHTHSAAFVLWNCGNTPNECHQIDISHHILIKYWADRFIVWFSHAHIRTQWKWRTKKRESLLSNRAKVIMTISNDTFYIGADAVASCAEYFVRLRSSSLFEENSVCNTRAMCNVSYCST